MGTIYREAQGRVARIHPICASPAFIPDVFIASRHQATVLLNANVAFLAIPSVDPGSNNNRTAAQIVSYISIVTSTGSIIIALLLIRQYRVKPRETVEEAVRT